MKYLEAMEYIESLAGLGSVPGLDNIAALCDKLDNPQNELRFIHIAGTNGKGSTLVFISSILSASGMKVGRYISPTISTYLERFQINGKPMSKSAFGTYVDIVKSACDKIVSEGGKHPTAFEIETAISFLYFRDKKCDIVLLECGMGGRLDATNIVDTTVMEVFAHIDMDHMQFLGESLTDIAGEKAGIIKNGTAVVSTSQYPSVSDVLRARCHEQHATYTEIDRSDIDRVKHGRKGLELKYKGKKYKTGLIGTYQVDNAALAIQTIETYNELVEEKANALVTDDPWWNKRKKISYETICKGLLLASWPGRLQILSAKPLIVIDGAHNPDAARRLNESIDTYFAGLRKIVIIGMFRDKAVDEVVSMLCSDADMVLTLATPGNPRALSSVELANIVCKYNNHVTSTDSVEEAVEMARMLADDNTLILACGSLSYLGKMIETVVK